MTTAHDHGQTYAYRPSHRQDIPDTELTKNATTKDPHTMTTACQLATQHGYTLSPDDIIQNPGRFEGEHVSVLFWYAAFLIGDGTYDAEHTTDFDITADDRAACPGIPADAKTARLTHHDSGFLTLSYHQ